MAFPAFFNSHGLNTNFNLVLNSVKYKSSPEKHIYEYSDSNSSVNVVRTAYKLNKNKKIQFLEVAYN